MISVGVLGALVIVGLVVSAASSGLLTTQRLENALGETESESQQAARKASVALENGAKAERIDRAVAMLSLVGTFALFHLVMVALLNWYYATRLPHYDSIGSYTLMARIVHMVRLGEFGDASMGAIEYHLAWLQSMFALALAPILSPTPAGFQLLNSLCVGVFGYSVYCVASGLGASRTQAYLASLVILLPDMLGSWDGGYQDLKRDGASFALLGACYFLTLAQLWNPSRWQGILLGISGGLSVWSRGNAPVYMALILCPLAIVWAVRQAWRRQWRSIPRALGMPLLIALVIAAPNLYFTFQGTFNRYTDPVAHYGHDIDPWQSLAYYGWTPLTLWATDEPNAGSNPERMWAAQRHTLWFVILAIAMTGIRPAFRRMLSGRVWALILAGVWSAASTIVLICFIVGWDPRFGWAGVPPFIPALLLPISLLVALLSCFHGYATIGPRRQALAWSAAVLVGGLSVFATADRMVDRARPDETSYVQDAQRVASLLSSERSSAVLAVMTHDRININTFEFLESGVNYGYKRRLFKFCWQYDGDPWNIPRDWATVLPPDVDVKAVQASILKQVQEGADYIIVNADVATYSKPEGAWNFFLFQKGAPIVQAMLDDPSMEQIAEYQLKPDGPDHRKFLVLRNNRRFPSRMARVPTPPAL